MILFSEIDKGKSWEFEFAKFPSSLYYPGDFIINSRLGNILLFNGENELVLKFSDREDRVISYFIKGWFEGICNGRVKSDIVTNCRIYVINSYSFETIDIYNCLIRNIEVCDEALVRVKFMYDYLTQTPVYYS